MFARHFEVYKKGTFFGPKIVYPLLLGSHHWTHRCHGVQRRWCQPLCPIWNSWNQLQRNIWQGCAKGNKVLSFPPPSSLHKNCTVLIQGGKYYCFKMNGRSTFVHSTDTLVIIFSNFSYTLNVRDNNFRLSGGSPANCSQMYYIL